MRTVAGDVATAAFRKTYHTAHRPHDSVDFTAKRVGTGASAVQAILVIAQRAKTLTVFQRTPNDCTSARNGKVGAAVSRARKASYDAIKHNIGNTYFGFELDFIMKPRPRRCSCWPTSGMTGWRVIWGSMVAGFPNFFTVTGPGSPSVLSNNAGVDRTAHRMHFDCVASLREPGSATIEATPDAESAWA